MDKFIIRAELLTPAIFAPHAATLDGLLGAVLYEGLQDEGLAHAAIPLACTEGLFHASTVQFDGARVDSKATFTASLRPQHDIDLDLIKKNSKGEIHRKIRLGNPADFGNVLNSYQASKADSVFWYAQGDAEATLELLQEVVFVGKRRTAGYGQVRGWELIETELDGLMTTDGLPLRPIPWDMWSGNPQALRADVAWRPAYWKPEHRAICAVPGIINSEGASV